MFLSVIFSSSLASQININLESLSVNKFPLPITESHWVMVIGMHDTEKPLICFEQNDLDIDYPFKGQPSCVTCILKDIPICMVE